MFQNPFIHIEGIRSFWSRHSTGMMMKGACVACTRDLTRCVCVFTYFVTSLRIDEKLSVSSGCKRILRDAECNGKLLCSDGDWNSHNVYKTALWYWYIVYKTLLQWNCTRIVACGFLYFVADIVCRHLLIPQRSNRLLSCLRNNSIYVCFALLKPPGRNISFIEEGKIYDHTAVGQNLIICKCKNNMIFKLNDAFVVAFEHCHRKLQTAQAGGRNVSANGDNWINHRIFLSCWRIKRALLFRQNIIFLFDSHTELRCP